VRIGALSLLLVAAAIAAGRGGGDDDNEFPATVKLSQPKDCRKNLRQFTHLVLTYTGARPQGASASLTEDYPCNGP
jgi:hypothetical protein